MHVNGLLLAIALSAAHLVGAMPLVERALPPNAPYSVPQSTVQKAITCPNGIKKQRGGIILLVHGTGSKGSESWGSGPYIKVLPTQGKKYDVCWIDLPQRSLVDAQISAEYVARAVSILAPQSSTGKVSIIGHSQGAGVNPQWAITFWPSIRSLISQYIALAPDFKGTTQGLLLCNPVAGGALPTCNPSLWQQTAGSKYLAAQNSPKSGSGRTALLPTSSIYTLTDEIVQPTLPRLNASAYLPGASVFALQDINVCGPLHAADHFSMVVDTAAYGLVRATLENGAPLKDLSKFDKTFCLINKDAPKLDFSAVPGLLQGVLADLIGIGTGIKSASEPTLQPYVCSRGFATNCGPRFKYPNPIA
ncbi:hypothetical protein OIO90_004091 [Microbotryomycetes sp. JL221]|nr:hypothetical protein OIO90_004091 [Microbotryomycetes sp. JL221]